MTLNVHGSRRLKVAAAITLRSAVVVGVPLWLTRCWTSRLIDQPWKGVATQVQGLIAAHDRLNETIGRRLRSLEESAARAEAEVRFMAGLLGEHAEVQTAQNRPSTQAGQVERPGSTRLREALRASSGGDTGAVKEATA